MKAEDMLKTEIQRLYALEIGIVSMLDLLDGRIGCRKIAVSIVMLIEAADRRLIDLDRICREEGWPLPKTEHSMAGVWREEVERDVLRALTGPATDAVCVALLRRSVYLRLPCYETARLYAFHAERPLIARMMRLALEDEQTALERLRSAAELGVSLRAALGGGPFTMP